MRPSIEWLSEKGPSDIGELRAFLQAQPDRDALREQLYGAFLEYARYRKVEEWNAAVKICESLAIIGWGPYEPVEAIRGQWFNGNPETYFLNSQGRARYLDAVWTKRKDGYAIDPEQTFFHGSREQELAKAIRQEGGIGETQDIPLCSQRNWIPKNPVRIVRGLANCYEGSKPLIESLEKELIPELQHGMRPELYGTAINVIVINLSFSFYDNYHCKTNYIIADEGLKLKQKDFYPKLLEMYSEQEIEDNGYYLRNRFTYGPFRTDSGTTHVKIALEKEFSHLPTQMQKRQLAEYLIRGLEQVGKRLERKISYDFPLMISDFKTILEGWITKVTT